MAKKKITELQLRSNVSETVNFPVDDGIQSYRVTAPQIESFVLRAGNVKNAALEDGAVTKDKLAVGAIARQNVRSIVDADSLTFDDDIALLSDDSFTLTLPTAVGVAGKIFTIKHNGTSLTQVYTLATTSAQTIGGIASGDYKLFTNQESLRIMSDGSNWVILNHYAETPWSSPLELSVSSTGSAPTKGSSRTEGFVWKRSGSECLWRYYYNQTASTAGVAGTGVYLFSLPSGLNFSSVINDNGESLTNMLSDIVGHGRSSSHSSCINNPTFPIQIIPYNSSTFIMLIGNDLTAAGSRNWVISSGTTTGSQAGYLNFATSNVNIFIDGSHAVNGWQP